MSVDRFGGDAALDSRSPGNGWISGDRRYVAFESRAGDIVAGDTNGADTVDVSVRDRVAGTTVRASVSAAGGRVAGFSRVREISYDGRVAPPASTAPDVVPADTDTRPDVFVRVLR